MKDQTGNVGLCFNLGSTFHFRIPWFVLCGTRCRKRKQALQVVIMPRCFMKSVRNPSVAMPHSSSGKNRRIFLL